MPNMPDKTELERMLDILCTADDYMHRTGTYRPSEVDPVGLMNVPEDWFVLPITRNRDSDVLARSNFAAALKMLGGESDDVQVHRFGHWGPGWFEVIIINPKTKVSTISSACDICVSIVEYPVLCETSYSKMLYDAASTYWDGVSMSEKVCMCESCGMSRFAARSDVSDLYSTPVFDLISEDL